MTVLVFGLLLLAGSINAATLTRNVGDSLAFTIIAFTQDELTCYLRTVQDGTLTFEHGKPSPLERYEVMDPGVFGGCAINVHDLSGADAGEWEVSYVSSAGKTDSTVFNLNIIGGPEIRWMNQINYPTAIGKYIDISLSKIDHKEECTLMKDDEAVKNAADGIRAEDPSEFVSCRYTIGPMAESLIGNWTLCGKHVTNGKDVERCRPVSVYWNNDKDPNSVWHIDSQSLYRHVVHLGGTLSPAVVGVGNGIVTCHVVTPSGEDLVIEEDSEYPNLQLLPSSTKESPVCNVKIGPILPHMLGYWTVYGKFESSLLGLNEVHFPFSTFLYDEENPYNQAYNVSVLEPLIRTSSIGQWEHLGVYGIGSVDSCEFTTPSRKSYNLNNYADFEGVWFYETEAPTGCGLRVGPITEELFGHWSIIGKFNNNGQFTEIRSIVEIVEEDPANPIQDDRTVEVLDRRDIVTEIGDSHKILIHSDTAINGESCHIVTPAGLQYTLIETFNVSGITVVDDPDVECGVLIKVQSTKSLGNWTLIAKATRHSDQIERRLPFTITVDEYEHVDATPRDIEVVEGRSVNVRLVEPTPLYQTCRLVGPNITIYTIDHYNIESCSFTVFNVHTSQQGTWEIVYYGETSTYRASIIVKVFEKAAIGPAEVTGSIEVVEGSSVEEEVGSENAVYCRLDDPSGETVFNNFGRCHLSIEEVDTARHNGYWRMFVGYPDKIFLKEELFLVNVTRSVLATAPMVTYDISWSRYLIIKCSLPSDQYEKVDSCKFRDPHGRVLLVTGDNEEVYTIDGEVIIYKSEIHRSTCTLKADRQLRNYGRWRCAVHENQNVHYGFPNVYDADHYNEFGPVLESQRDVYVQEGVSAVMSCTVVNAPIDYCYFRSQNGTVFNVHPQMRTPTMEYVGEGFNAGDCGIKFQALQPSDSGTWSCHAGLRYNEEKRARISVFVEETMHVTHHREMTTRTVVVAGYVYHGKPLDYCRFVRIDGLGFTTDNVPSQYFSASQLSSGICEIRIPDPIRLDLHPWTIVAKPVGELEISRTTSTSFNVLNSGNNGSAGTSGMLLMLYVLLAVAFVSLVIGMAPKRNRRWVGERYQHVRQSFRKRAPTTIETPNTPTPPQYTP